MTPHQKAVNAINARLERLQANLTDATTETARQLLFQALVVSVGLAEALNDYITGVGEYAKRRHAAVKQANEALAAEHVGLLATGRELLEKLKAEPTDRALRKQIEGVQQKMAAIQKSLRRGANALRRELAPGLALIDELAVVVRRLAEADQRDTLQRGLKAVIGHVRPLYAAQFGAAAKDLVNAAAWEQAAVAEVDRATDFTDAYARAGYQATLALEWLALSVAEPPPHTPAEATERATAAVTRRLKAVAARFTAT